MFEGSANARVRQQLQIGQPVPGHSWPDKYVVANLVAQFGTSDSVFLVTENRRQDVGGLRDTLLRVVKPAFETADYCHLSLCVFMKKGRTAWSAYSGEVLARLRAGRPGRGYCYEEV